MKERNTRDPQKDGFMSKALTDKQYVDATEMARVAAYAALPSGIVFCVMFLDNYDYPPVPLYQDPRIFFAGIVLIAILIGSFLASTRGAPLILRCITILGLITLAIVNGWFSAHTEFKSGTFIVTFLLALVAFPMLVLFAQRWLLSRRASKD